MNNWGNVELKVTIDKSNITNELIKTFEGCQKEADSHKITYRIAGDKSSLESMLKQIQGMKPELLTKMNLEFDKSYYETEMKRLRETSGKTATQIGEDFKTHINNSLKGFNVKSIIGKDLKSSDILNVKDVGKLKGVLQDLMSQTGNFDLSKATSINEINEQVTALNKMKIILETLSKHSSQKSIKIDNSSFNIAEMLQNNTSQIDSIMENVGQVIHSNASQWATTLESTFNKEFDGIVNLFNNLKSIIDGVFSGTGTGGSGGGYSQEFERLQTQIDKTIKDIEELETKLAKLKEDSKPAVASEQILGDKRRGVVNFATRNELSFRRNNEEKIAEFKQVVNEYMSLGGKLEDIENKITNKYIKQFDIQQILPSIPENVSQEIARVTSELELLKSKRDELILQQQNIPKDGTGAGTGTGTGQGAGTGVGIGTGTPTDAIISPKLSGDFKQKLQEQVTAIGSVDATVSGKLSENFLGDVQGQADQLGNVKVGVNFGQKEGTESQKIPVDVVTTPKLSETFQEDLQQLIDKTGKYTVSVGANQDNQKDPVLVKAKAENGEEFRTQLKQAVEGTDGLDIKVKPVVEENFELEIKNAVLKGVKVEGTIEGGNLKPASVDTSSSSSTAPVASPSTTSVASSESKKEAANQNQVQKELEKTKQKHDEVGQAAVDSSNKQSNSILQVIKDITRLRKEQEGLRKIYEANIENINLLLHYSKKSSKYKNLDKDGYSREINSHYNEINRDSGESNIETAWTTIIALADKYKKITGEAFKFEDAKAQSEFLERQASIYPKLTKAQQEYNKSKEAEKKEKEIISSLNSKTQEKGNLAKTADEAGKLEVELSKLIIDVEDLKAKGKNGNLVNINTQEFKDFFELWKQYKSIGGTGNISDFTNEAKVINSVNKAYATHISQIKAVKAEEEKRAQSLQKQLNSLKKQLSEKFPDADLSKFTKVFDDFLANKKSYADAYREIRESIIAMQSAANGHGTTTATPKIDPNKPVKPLGNGEVIVTPKVEDPSSFANQVTEQLKGQSAVIDVKPNIVWDKTNSTRSNNVQNKELNTQIESYNRMIEKMKEYVELQKVVAQENAKIVATWSNGQFMNVDPKDLKNGIPTQASIKRRLESYLKNPEDTSQKEKLASYVAAFNNADKAQQIFGKNNKTLFAEIQLMIEKSKASLDAFNESHSKLNGIAKDALIISGQKDIGADKVDVLGKILNTGDIDKTVQYLQQTLGLQIPQAAQQAKTAIDGIGEQVKQEGQEANQTQIPIKLSADIESLNTSIQSKKEQILPVDVKLNPILSSNTSTATDVGTTGMSYETQQAETLRQKIVEVTTAVDNKTRAFQTEEQVVTGTVQREISNLEALDGQLFILLQTLERIQQTPIKLNIITSEEFFNSESNVNKLIQEIKTSLDGLNSDVLKNLNNVLQALNINESVATNVQRLANAVLNLKSNLNNVSPASTEFLNSIKELVAEGSKLKDLATVISATKEKLKQAKEVVVDKNSTGKGQDLADKIAAGREKSNIRTKLNDKKLELSQAKAINKSLEDEYKQEQNLVDKIANGREKSNIKSQQANREQELAQAKAINKSLEDEYKQEQKLIEKMASGREKATVQSQKNDRKQELAQSKAINKALEDEYNQRQKNIKAAEKQNETKKNELLKLTQSLSSKLTSAISKYSYGDVSDASAMQKQLNIGISNFSEKNALNLSSIVDKIISDLKLSHEQSLKALNEEINAEQKLQSQKDSFNKKNLNAIDFEIQKREEASKAFSASLKAQMEEEQKLVEQMASGREKASIRTQAEDKKLELAQAKAHNAALEEEYKQEQKLIEQMASGREKADVKSKQADKQQELAQSKAINKALEDEYNQRQKLTEQMASGREKSSIKSQSEEKKLELAQAKAINKALEDEYKQEQKLAEQMAAGREKANIKSQKVDRQQELTQAKAINKALEDEYQARIKAEEKAEKELQSQRDKFNKSNMNGIDFLIKKHEEEARAFSASLKAKMEADAKAQQADAKAKQNEANIKSLKDVSSIEQAYRELMSTEEEYQRLKAKADTKTAKKTDLNRLNELIAKRDLYNEKLNQTTVLTEKEMQLSRKYADKVEVGQKVYNSTVANNSITDPAKLAEVQGIIQQTNSSLEKLFKPNVSGFENAFNRAKDKVEDLNATLLTGQVSNVQTEYTDKVNKIFQDLNKVIGVTDPLGTNPEAIKDAERQMREYATTINNGKVSVGDFNQKTGKMIVSFEREKNVLQEVELSWNSVTGEISETPGKIKKAKSAFTMFADGLKARFKSLIQYLTIFVSYYRIIGMIKNGIQVVRDLDTSLTNMRKVSDETVESLKNFQDVSFDIASNIGSTAKQIQESAADFMRLGYSLKEASELAEDANIYANVGEMEIDTATEHMISSIKAWESEFSNEVEASAAIVDRYNEIGNNFAISSADIGSAMERSAAALKAGGNTLNESLGLIVAGNIIQQDAETTAAALKIMSLRIRGSKTELEEMGEETDGLASSTSKLRAEIKALSGVDIMADENTYKSTAEIIKELGAVYEQMTDVSQAALLEKIAGKNRASTVEGLLQNYEVINEVIESAENAEGSAIEENLRYMESIEGKIAQFTNEVQEFWYTLIDSDTIKGFIDLGTNLIDVIGNITGEIGVLGTAIAGLSTAYGISAIKSSGGRTKKVCPHSKNMPPNRLAVRCASSGVYRNANICSSE